MLPRRQIEIGAVISAPPPPPPPGRLLFSPPLSGGLPLSDSDSRFLPPPLSLCPLPPPSRSSPPTPLPPPPATVRGRSARPAPGGPGSRSAGPSARCPPPPPASRPPRLPLPPPPLPPPPSSPTFLAPPPPLLGPAAPPPPSSSPRRRPVPAGPRTRQNLSALPPSLSPRRPVAAPAGSYPRGGGGARAATRTATRVSAAPSRVTGPGREAAVAQQVQQYGADDLPGDRGQAEQQHAGEQVIAAAIAMNTIPIGPPR